MRYERIQKNRRRHKGPLASWCLMILFLALCVYALVSIWMQQGRVDDSLSSSLSSSSSSTALLPVSVRKNWKHSLAYQLSQIRNDPDIRQHNQQHQQAVVMARQQRQQQQSQEGPLSFSQPRYYSGHKVYLHPSPSTQSSSSNSTSRSHHRPLLSTLVQDEQIIGNVQFLLDFVVAGFGKAGTSTIMEWLAGHPSVAMFSREVYHLVHQRPDKLVVSLYEDLPADTGKQKYIRGYKNPLEVTLRHVLDYYRIYFNQTKLIVGLRHPIRYFESLYNFRVQNLLPGEEEMLDPNYLIGRCYPERKNTCTEKANFAHALLQLGKTNIGNSSPKTPSPLAEQIVGPYQRLWFNVSTVPFTPNPIFLYHMEQLQTSPEKLGRDLCAFLGISADLLPPVPHLKPGLTVVDPAVQREKDRQKIDICDMTYKPVRRELLRTGSLGAQWIAQEFLNSSSTVHVSDPIGFRKLLEEWSIDPCGVPSGVAPGGHSSLPQHQWSPPRPPPKNDPMIRGAVSFRVPVGDAAH